MRKYLLCFVFLAALSVVTKLNAQTPQYYCAGGNSSNTFPFSTVNKQIQWLVLNSDFTSMPPTGFITKVYWRASTTAGGPSTYTNFEIQLGNTPLTSIPSTTYSTTLTTVLSSPSFTTTTTAVAGTSGGSNGWIGFDLATPFYYDNTQNLMIKVQQSGTSNGFYIYQLASGTGKRIYGDIGNSAGLGLDAYRCDFGIDIFAGFPCIDTPKSLVDALSPVCPNKVFTVKPATYYANANYQWQFSDNGVTWQNHPAVLGLYGDIQDALTKPRWYRCMITCIANGLSYTTPAKKVDIAPFYYCYCDNRSTAAAGLDIGNVTMNRLPEDAIILNNGISTPALVNTTASRTYTSFQYTVAPVPIYRDSSFKVSVSEITSATTMPANANVAVFIDFNRNGIFDGSEKVMKKTINAASLVQYTESSTFEVPKSAEIGLTGMRVIMGTGNIDSCGTFAGEGEVEDYLVDIRYEPCTTAANPGIIEPSDTSMCKGYDYLLRDTSYEKRKSELERLWQISPDNLAWYDAGSVINNDTLMRIFNKQPFYYRVRQICPRGQRDTTYTEAKLIKAKDGNKCYCYSQAVGGTAADSSDIGGISIGDFVFNTGGPHLLNQQAYRKRTDHTEEPPLQLYIDSLYKLSVYHTQHSAIHADGKVTVFIDFNNNKEYDMPYERVLTNYTSISNFTLADTFTIPSIAITGVPTGMRVILNNNISPNNPSDEGCGAYQSGETHDFMVVLNHKPFPASIGAIEGMEHFGLFPNPSNGKFRVQFNSTKAMNEVGITVTNVTGQQVYQQIYKHNGGSFNQELDLGNVAKGMYFVELNADGQRVKQKLVIE